MKAEDLNLTQILKTPIEYARKASIKELEELITLFKEYYYNTDTPLVPDLIYDQIEDVLRERSPKSSALAMIGAPVKNAVKLPFPMPSLDKVKADQGTANKWFEKYPGPYVVSHKLDGISMMYYQDSSGKVKLYTRGNGAKGQDVTGILKYIDVGEKNVKIPPKFLKKGESIAIRGELIMPKKIWDQYYARDNSNVRNFVAGLANAKHPNPVDLRRVQLVAYQLMMPRMEPSEQLNIMDEWGFHVVSYVLENKLDESKMMLKLDRARQRGQYQIDGLVIAQDKLFELTERNPKHSIAFKSVSDEIAQTEVIKVIWKASKRGILKPTVMIEPVFLSGANLSRATGHNAKYIIDQVIGPGAMVTIVRSGEVIPYILSVDSPAPDGPDLPENEYEWDQGGIDILLTEETEEVSHSMLVHMAKTLEIKNFGPAAVQKVIDAGYSTPAEVLNMTYEEWQDVGLGKNAEKIWNNMAKLQTDGVWLAQLMDSTTIFGHGLGQRMMQSVLNEYPDLVDRRNEVGLLKKLIAIKGIQKKTAEKIIQGLEEFSEFMDLVPHIRIKDDDSEDSSEESSGIDEFDGMRVVFTGVRDKELEALIKRSGGVVASSVLKSHDNQVVVAKDPTAQSNKLKMARQHGYTIYSLTEFKEEYGIE